MSREVRFFNNHARIKVFKLVRESRHKIVNALTFMEEKNQQFKFTKQERKELQFLLFRLGRYNDKRLKLTQKFVDDRTAKEIAEVIRKGRERDKLREKGRKSEI